MPGGTEVGSSVSVVRRRCSKGSAGQRRAEAGQGLGTAGQGRLAQGRSGHAGVGQGLGMAGQSWVGTGQGSVEGRAKAEACF